MGHNLVCSPSLNLWGVAEQTDSSDPQLLSALVAMPVLQPPSPILFPKPESRAVERARQKRQQRALTAAVRATLRVRDTRCRVCGILFCASVRAELHHIQFRSQGGATTTQNTLLLCPACHHGQIHGRRIRLIIEDSARGADGVVTTTTIGGPE